jgi:anti-sigma factor ChrR (cupin superfamily)
VQNLNLDFSQSLVIDTEKMAWLSSAANGVKRKPLARAADESGHATSIVHYEVGASYNRHLHPCGEEIMVLEGTFSDEKGNSGAGSYIQNPPGTGHSSFSKKVCTLFVKLHQFGPQDNKQFVTDTDNAHWQCEQNGQQVMLLHQCEGEQVMLIRCTAGNTILIPEHNGGEELLVLSGELFDQGGNYSKGTWLRRRASNQLLTALFDILLWFKLGHFTV